MTEFERALVKAFNRYFKENDIDGIAYRRKQHKFSDQFLDILVDSQEPRFYLGIENKSVKSSSCKKLYFTQHFSNSNGTHQIEKITEFLKRSGRKGYLALELRRGRGKPRKAFLIPWNRVKRRYESDNVGIDLQNREDYIEINRNSKEYDIERIFK